MKLPDGPMPVESMATVMGHLVPDDEQDRSTFVGGSTYRGTPVTVEVGQGILTWLVIHNGDADITVCLGLEQGALLGCALKVAAGKGT